MSTVANITATGWRANAVGTSDVRTVRRNGREYLQFPIVPLTEMVLDYPERGTKEYLPAAHIRETGDLWDGTLLTYVHPENRNSTVRDPDAFMGDVIGAFHNPEVLDSGERLKGTGLIDVEKAQSLGGHAAELVELLQQGEQVSVSAGYATVDDEPRSGRFDGEQYDMVQGPPLPDHIAVFPSDSRMQARCSPEDGCAAPKANAYQPTANQRANYELDSKMNATVNGSVFPSEEERQKAIDTIQREAPDVGPDIRKNDDGVILTVAQGFGYSLPNCNCAETCTCNRENARQSRSVPNMSAVPGQMNRNYEEQRGEDPEEYPAGGRRSWERRKVGLDDVPSESEEYPAGGRSSWEKKQAEKRRANAERQDSGSDPSGGAVGTRSNYEQRRAEADDSEKKEWLTEEYPLTARRRTER